MSAERPRREVAYRLFAAEFEDADYSYAESDEERAPNYVVTPTGARVNRLFVVGVLTEIESVGDDVLRARIVDPTGAFVVYAGQYQPEALAFFERADPPTFVAVTGKARTFQPEGSDRIFTSVRPESVNEVTAETRDRWVVQTAEHTLDRIETFAGALELPQRGDALQRELADRGISPSLASGIPHAIDHYGTTTGYLAAMRQLAIDAAGVVAGERDEVDRPTVAPDEDADVPLDVDAELPETRFDRESEPAVEPAADEESELDDGDERADGSTDEPSEPPEESATASEPEPTPDTEAEPEPESETAETDEPPEEAADTDEMYELSEEERAEVEENFGVGFETGNEVQEPGEADIEAPEPEPAAEDAAPDDELEESEEPPAGDAEEVETPEEEADETGAPDAEDADDVDLEDAVVETMSDLDDGEGAPREDLIVSVRDEYGVDEAAVEDAIQDALMGGRCYESGEDRLTPI